MFNFWFFDGFIINYKLSEWDLTFEKELQFYTLQTEQYYKWRMLIIEHIKVSATTFFTLKNLLLFDLGLRQSIHTCWLFSQNRLAWISDKSRSKRDSVFDGAVIFIHYKMIKLHSITNENNKDHNEKWSYIPDHPYRILIIGGSGWGKINALLNLIEEQDDIDKIYLHEKDLSERK